MGCSGRVSVSCILALSLHLSARFISVVIKFNQVASGEWVYGKKKMEDLDSKYLEDLWKHRILPTSNMVSVSKLFNALSFLVLILPVLQVALVLSDRGKRKLGLHLFMALLAILGFFMEAISNFLVTGARISLDWIARDFNMSSWSDSDDGLGWKVITIVDVVTRGMMIWTDAFEYAVLASILIITFVSVKTSPKTPFPQSWATFSLIVGILCALDFVFAMLRLLNWEVFGFFLLLSQVGTVVLVPVWILVLSFLLPDAVDTITMEDDRNDLEMTITMP